MLKWLEKKTLQYDVLAFEEDRDLKKTICSIHPATSDRLGPNHKAFREVLARQVDRSTYSHVPLERLNSCDTSIPLHPLP